jgi:hypothetical protein
MVTLLDSGAYLVNGTDIVPDNKEAASALKAKTGRDIRREDARKSTIAYGILKEHNTSGSMDKLKRHHIRRHYPDRKGFGASEIPHALCAYQLPQFTLRSRRHNQ